METWEHPALGTFYYSGGSWDQDREFDAFGIFLEARGEQLLTLPVGGDSDEAVAPEEDVVVLAVRIVENLPTLIEAGIAAFWDDLNGRGPSSGMWWHGALGEAFEYCSAEPTDHTSLYVVLQPSAIALSSAGYLWDAPTARIQFRSDIDEEHGVSFLTDGTSIIGTGYSHDSSPFTKPK
jgi:hypothetical protein